MFCQSHSLLVLEGREGYYSKAGHAACFCAHKSENANPLLYRC